MWFCQKPNPQHHGPQLGGISPIQSFFLKTERFMPHVRHPSPWGLQWRYEPPKYLALKMNGTHVQETHGWGCRELRHISYRAHTQTNAHQGKQQFEKCSDFM